MRVITMMVMLVSACRFAPGGDGGATADASASDAAGSDGGPVDARALDAPVTDATAIDAPASCPAGYTVLTLGHRFAFRPIAMQLVPASEDCADDLPGKTHLATFEIGALMDSIVTAVDPGNQATPYVGAKCAVGDCNAKSSWFWVTGILVDFTIWNDNQPDNGTTETAAMVERANGTWKLSNTSAVSTLPYICECDP